MTKWDSELQKLEEVNENMRSNMYQIPFIRDVDRHQDYKRNCKSISPFS
jgi:hypothetical protein